MQSISRITFQHFNAFKCCIKHPLIDGGITYVFFRKFTTSLMLMTPVVTLEKAAAVLKNRKAEVTRRLLRVTLQMARASTGIKTRVAEVACNPQPRVQYLNHSAIALHSHYIVCFITKSFLTFSFLSPAPALSTICWSLSSYLWSITPETTKVCRSYSHMWGQGITETEMSRWRKFRHRAVPKIYRA